LTKNGIKLYFSEDGSYLEFGKLKFPLIHFKTLFYICIKQNNPLALELKPEQQQQINLVELEKLPNESIMVINHLKDNSLYAISNIDEKNKNKNEEKEKEEEYTDSEIGAEVEQEYKVRNNIKTRKTLVQVQPEVKFPSLEEINRHNVTHIPHQKWCEHCVKGRIIRDRSHTVNKEERILQTNCVIQFDYLEYGHNRSVLVMVDTMTGYMSARVVETKAFVGLHDPKIAIILHFIRELGHTQIILQSDHAQNLNQLLSVVCDVFKRGLDKEEKRLSKVIRCTSRSTAGHSSNSNGSVERAIRIIRDQIRVMMSHFEEEINKTKDEYDSIFKIDISHELFIYLVRHATWIINRCIKTKGPLRKLEIKMRRKRRVIVFECGKFGT
jgi:hypothetical protein